MRITFNNPIARDLGIAYEEFARHFLHLSPEEEISQETLQAVEDRFHSMTAQEHIEHFAQPVWHMFEQHLFSADFERRVTPLPKAKGPVIAGVKEAPDLIYESSIGQNGFEINALGFYKGGLATNTVHALRLLNTYANFVPLLGDGPKAKIHRELMESSGIDLTREVVSNGVDAYIHFCSLFSEGKQKQENWMAQYRVPFSRETIDAFTYAIEQALKENQGEILVLSALAPAGSGDDYFAELTSLGKQYSSPTAFNSKQYDALPSVKRLFEQGELRLIKPNLVEFVQFLRFTGILYEDSSTAESEIYQRLKKQISKGNFKETFDLARLLIEQINPDMVIFLSFSEHGAMAVNKDHAVIFGAPRIKLGCSSGAGDSGLAGIIKTVKDSGYNLWNTLKEDELANLLQAFIYSASATASLEGNNIAGMEEIVALRNSELLPQYKI